MLIHAYVHTYSTAPHHQCTHACPGPGMTYQPFNTSSRPKPGSRHTVFARGLSQHVPLGVWAIINTNTCNCRRAVVTANDSCEIHTHGSVPRLPHMLQVVSTRVKWRHVESCLYCSVVTHANVGDNTNNNIAAIAIPNNQHMMHIMIYANKTTQQYGLTCAGGGSWLQASQACSLAGQLISLPKER